MLVETETRPILECRDLRKTYKDLVAVDGVGFHIDRGETYGLLGPNGAGKTTTIAMVCGLLKRDAGEVTVAGKPLTIDSIDAKRAIGYVPQDIAIYPDLTARENLLFFGKLYDIGSSELKQRTEEVLDVIGLRDRANDSADDFSGGMKRRLNIGVGLLHRPQLLVLDEPTVGVDPQSRNAILESIESLSTEGMAVLYTTHYMEEAERLCDRIGIIDHGKLVAEGTRRELIEIIGGHDRIRLRATGDLEAAAAAAREAPCVQEAAASSEGLDVIADQAADALVEILGKVTGTGASVSSVSIEEPDLESVFLHLTGRGLRD